MMFRNPRENTPFRTYYSALPSVGRPPTPPLNDSPYFSLPSSQSNVVIKSSPAQTPMLRRHIAPKMSSAKKNGLRQNQSILNFFGKSDKTITGQDGNKPDQGLFFEDRAGDADKDDFEGIEGSSRSMDSEVPMEDELNIRYNEMETPVKRRRFDEDLGFLVRTPSPERAESSTTNRLPPKSAHSGKISQRKSISRSRGGFIDDSDDEESIEDPDDVERSGYGESFVEEEDNDANREEIRTTSYLPLKSPDESAQGPPASEQDPLDLPLIPTLSREATSMLAPDDFDETEEFETDEFFEQGEEYMERKWMEEQREMELAFDEDSKSESGASALTPRDNISSPQIVPTEVAEAACPLCNGSLKGLSETQALSHVNACLDGIAEPLQKLDTPLKNDATPSDTAETAPAGSSTWQSKRFQRAALARPGQSNPFSFAKNEKVNTGSAFTRLMSGHAEDAAWAEAAANEATSRGKPAYQRTCPFYKIMPGLYICVDAFRYGKVEGQNAYFLSHFHSDHYIGLTSSWCHGPIYASKVTCNLMRQQLRVDEKWLVPLEFEKKVEVPNTKGVTVTMLPANHCPGSSLYLFEKVVGKHKDGSPKLNRILHCGDFRACPAHVNHPLLQPDTVDAISGHTRQQVIDTCYLDTTYLTPKYSFPSQQDVIDACAQMCVSLAKEAVDAGDTWEKVKAERAGSVMTKFLEQSEASTTSNTEQETPTEDKRPKARGKLLVVIGTYSIGKERICLGIAKALNSKIYAPPAKMRICKCLEDAELNALLTSNPLEAQVHMQTLMEIRAETLHDYLITYRGHFSRVVGFRPTGWSYRPPTSRFTENPAVNTVLHSEGWKSRFSMRDLAPQRGSTKESNCFGVPYSEHSSFRELTMFCCALRIGRVVPTVNVGSAKSREKMKGWIEKWEVEKKKNGLFRVEAGIEGWGSGDGKLRYGV